MDSPPDARYRLGVCPNNDGMSLVPLQPLKTSLVALLIGLTMSAPVSAEGLSGSYLAARQAGIQSDFKAAADYFTRALARDASNQFLLENALSSYVDLGDFEHALLIARRLQTLQADSQVANLVMTVNAFGQGRTSDLLADLDAGMKVMPLVDGLARAWAEIDQGNMTAAIEAFDAISATQGLDSFGRHHKALALASAGDFEGSEKLFAGEGGDELRLDRRGIEARLQVLSQLERDPEGIALIDRAFGPELDPVMAGLRARLTAGETLPFTAVASARDGMAEVFYMVASALSADAAPAYTLLFSRAAQELSPGHVDAILLSAGLLERLNQFSLATQAYDRVPRDHPEFYSAELGRAEALRRDGKVERAVEVLTQLSESHPDLPIIQMSLGDLLRQQSDYAGAVVAYEKAISLYDKPQDASWRAFYVRGISYERTDQWDKAEADLRFALELRPDEPRVLNYLGYSLLEMNLKLDEALAMIEKAVKASPDSGYIIDSLGWALFRMGRYNDAVDPMERAVELMPLDPVVNDHVGDVYWAVGRQREANFQWRRALSFEPEPEEAKRIRRKLEVGLNAVLKEEGADPISVANDG